ncbi:hypothetical protein VSX64_09860 [Aurantimonas sp. C2-6-R+9]|uniref:hypothetical protein n=1 Tax=unclassified Aurantimonas TaxID=2638230 RepID=UPI002E1882BA|nr:MULTISPECIES: hypothetical protein [unclassified Aurantimonas]MEC5289958.1 hypothetical protein [Aurantimonas sp. C2-3-R2]MEC5381180.1 hypothetical protein [Aurantimonas sp. C2-6-R+9]MEC5411023.1 hypothetical protein [Aurantimonas sp. C2-4-R8]
MTIFERIDGDARWMLAIADAHFEGWEKTMIADAITAAVTSMFDEIIAQRTA